MKWRSLAAPAVLFSLAMASAPMPAAADDFTIDTTLPFSETVVNSCNGDTVLFTGENHIVIQFDMGTASTFHYKFHANGRLGGDVIAPVPALDVYSASQTDDEENTVSPGNDITNVVTTFVAINHVDPHFNMKLITEFQINFKSKTIFNSHTNARCDPIIL